MRGEDEFAQEAKRYVDDALESRRRLGYPGAVSGRNYATAVAAAAFRELSAVPRPCEPGRRASPDGLPDPRADASRHASVGTEAKAR